MDFHSIVGYLEALSMLYAWTLFAAAAFSVGERVCRSLFVQEQSAPRAQDQANG
jgi:hypothetical protein